jgi:putative addiction module antidote
MAITKIIAIGKSAGIILPEELLQRLKLQKGDTVYISETPGCLRLSPRDEEFGATMEVTDEMIRGHLDASRKLAK